MEAAAARGPGVLSGVPRVVPPAAGSSRTHVRTHMHHPERHMQQHGCYTPESTQAARHTQAYSGLHKHAQRSLPSTLPAQDPVRKTLCTPPPSPTHTQGNPMEQEAPVGSPALHHPSVTPLLTAPQATTGTAGL